MDKRLQVGKQVHVAKRVHVEIRDDACNSILVSGSNVRTSLGIWLASAPGHKQQRDGSQPSSRLNREIVSTRAYMTYATTWSARTYQAMPIGVLDKSTIESKDFSSEDSQPLVGVRGVRVHYEALQLYAECWH